MPKASLLNRFGDVRADGVYYSMVSSKSKRFQFQIGSLSGGRIAIAQVSADIALAALTTTLRFFAVRKQFKNPVTKQETLLLDYRINQYRLFLIYYSLISFQQITIYNKNYLKYYIFTAVVLFEAIEMTPLCFGFFEISLSIISFVFDSSIKDSRVLE